jgi:hypothetical protein
VRRGSAIRRRYRVRLNRQRRREPGARGRVVAVAPPGDGGTSPSEGLGLSDSLFDLSADFEHKSPGSDGQPDPSLPLDKPPEAAEKSEPKQPPKISSKVEAARLGMNTGSSGGTCASQPAHRRWARRRHRHRSSRRRRRSRVGVSCRLAPRLLRRGPGTGASRRSMGRRRRRDSIGLRGRSPRRIRITPPKQVFRAGPDKRQRRAMKQAASAAAALTAAAPDADADPSAADWTPTRGRAGSDDWNTRSPRTWSARRRWSGSSWNSGWGSSSRWRARRSDRRWWSSSSSWRQEAWQQNDGGPELGEGNAIHGPIYQGAPEPAAQTTMPNCPACDRWGAHCEDSVCPVCGAVGPLRSANPQGSDGDGHVAVLGLSSITMPAPTATGTGFAGTALTLVAYCASTVMACTAPRTGSAKSRTRRGMRR